ncbi:TPA: iron-sulfur cluster assembly scaffold protein [Candidatus Bathyarchaeota archaeon]|nr:iron-sulfur cluster assembly scaffold protein [Candidatus Bathyarchaeota archaeon]
MPVKYAEKTYLKYSEKLIELFKNPKNVGEMEDATITATEGSPVCGDVMQLSLKIEEGKIVDAKFLSFGCAANIATGSVLTEMVKGIKVDEAEKITMETVAKEVGGLPPVKMHCAVLAAKALKKAIKEYKRRPLKE